MGTLNYKEILNTSEFIHVQCDCAKQSLVSGSGVLSEVNNNFFGNASKLASLCLLPGKIFFGALSLGKAGLIAADVLTGTIRLHQAYVQPMPDELKAKQDEIWHHLISPEGAHYAHAMDSSGNPVPSEDSTIHEYEYMCNMEESIGDGNRAYYEAIIVQAWTVFEALASDLWIKSVNNVPRYLAPLTGNPGRISELAGAKTKAKASAADETDRETELDAEQDLDEEFSIIAESSEKKVPLGLLYQVTKGRYDPVVCQTKWHSALVRDQPPPGVR